jgi:hypothetical protein
MLSLYIYSLEDQLMQWSKALKTSPGLQQYLIAAGAFVLAIIYTVGRANNNTALHDVGQRLAGTIDVPLAVLISIASITALAGLWKTDPQTATGQWVLRSVIAVLVFLNLGAWGVAVWLH